MVVKMSTLNLLSIFYRSLNTDCPPLLSVALSPTLYSMNMDENIGLFLSRLYLAASSAHLNLRHRLRSLQITNHPSLSPSFFSYFVNLTVFEHELCRQHPIIGSKFLEAMPRARWAKTLKEDGQSM